MSVTLFGQDTRTAEGFPDGGGWDAATMATLLGRTPRRLDIAAAEHVARGRVVLITGAGGSIGGALARTLAGVRPARLVLVDQGEYALWRVGQDLADTAPDVSRQAVIADIRDAARLRRVFGAARPDLVVHAAALKHVPIVQDHPLEGLLSNTIGTRHVIDAARAAGAATVVLVSTDKAVMPTSVMGASKRLAEIYGQAVDAAAPAFGERLRCVSLRLGNVMGSAGSVAQLFRRQLASGGPLTITHPDMRRYFLAPEEAIGLLIAAARLAARNELARAAVLVPRMAPPVRILDLALRMIHAEGRRREQGRGQGRDIAIRFTTPRAGEKLAERTCHGGEAVHATMDPALLATHPPAVSLAILARSFDALEAACRAGEERLALTLVSGLIPAFDHRPEGCADRLRA